MRSILHLSVLVPFFLVLTACSDYQLRGNNQLKQHWPELIVQAKGNQHDLKRYLNRQLQSSGVNTTVEQSPVLRILSARFNRQVLSLDSRGRVGEFELQYQVKFLLEDYQGNTLLHEYKLEINRNFNFNDQQVLGKHQEEKQIRQEMIRDMASRILEILILNPS